MSTPLRALRRSLVVAPVALVAAALLAACTGSPLEPQSEAAPATVRHFQIDSLLLVDPRGYVPLNHGSFTDVVRIDSIDVHLLVEVDGDR